MDGKEPNHGGGKPSSVRSRSPVSFTWAVRSSKNDKTNEIPVARQLFERLDLEGRLVFAGCHAHAG